MCQLSRVCPLPRIKMRISWRDSPRRNPQNGVEGIHWIEAAVESKYELIEVGLQMTGLDTAVMGAIDPRLQIGKDKVDHRQMLFRLLRIAPKRERVMSIPNLAKAAIPMPAVSADGGACRYAVLDEGSKRISIAAGKRIIRLFDAGDNAEPETASISEFLDRNAACVGILPFRTSILCILARLNLNSTGHCSLMMNAPSFATRAAANATFVYFDRMRRADGAAVWPHHPPAKFVKHSERRLIPGDPAPQNQVERGIWLDCMTVPAVSDVFLLQARQRNTTDERVSNRYGSPTTPHSRQEKPPGQRIASK